MRRIPVGDSVLEFETRGSGEPVVLIQTALVADELLRLADQSPLRDHYQLIVYRRRGYGGSSPVRGPGSVARDAKDCRDLLNLLEVEHAHVVGVSYSAAVALQLALTTNTPVHTLTVIEPPPLYVSKAEEFVAANNELLQLHRTFGASYALDNFLTRLMGRNWREDLEEKVPSAVEQVERDATTFFETDIPALLTWEFSREAADLIRQPTLHIGGTNSGPWFAEVREQMLDWLPAPEDVLIDGADHNLAATHPTRIAQEIAEFISRYPIE